MNFNSTSEAKTSGEELLADAKYYSELVGQLNSILTQITSNWTGEGTDINDIIERVTEVGKAFSSKIIPAMTLLGNGVVAFAENVEAIAASQNGEATQQSAKDASSSSGSGSEGGYWSKRGADFKDDWDYSNCDGALDYVAATASGLYKTFGDAGETLLDSLGPIGNVAGDIFSGVYDVTGNVVSGVVDVGTNLVGGVLDFIF